MHFRQCNIFIDSMFLVQIRKKKIKMTHGFHCRVGKKINKGGLEKIRPEDPRLASRGLPSDDKR